MTLLNEMITRAKEHVVGYTDFMLKYKAAENKLYCFFEANNDIIFYSPIIRLTIQHERLEVFTCSNKEGVIRVFETIKMNKEYRKAKTGYFVDKDFDPLLKIPGIYVTPCYALENFYTTPSVLEKVLRYDFKMVAGHPDYVKCMDLFIELQKKFHKATLSLNAFLACYATSRSRNKALTHLHIDDKMKFPHPLFSPDMLNVNLNGHSYDELDRIFGTKRAVSKKKFKRNRTRFSKMNQQILFRGKFEMAFFISFLGRLKLLLNDTRFVSRKYTTGLSFKIDSIYSELNSHATVPNCLRKYILNI